MLFFLIGAGLIYVSAGIGYRKEFFPPRKRKAFQLSLTHNTLIVPDGWTVPLTGFDAFEDPRIWYPVSKRIAFALLALGSLFLTAALAWKLLPEGRVNEDRVFLAFMGSLVLGQFLIWVWSTAWPSPWCGDSRSYTSRPLIRSRGRGNCREALWFLMVGLGYLIGGVADRATKELLQQIAQDER